MNLPAFSLSKAFIAQFKTELLLRWRNKSDLLQPVIFFLIVSSLFPLAVNIPNAQLQKFAPGILWVILLLASLLSSESLFREDYRDGSLVRAILSPQPLFLYVLAKLLVHSLVVLLPLMLITPVIALMFNVPLTAAPTLMLSVFLGGVSLCVLAAIGSALTVSIGQQSLLLGLIVLPMYIPVLIFASSAIQLNIDGHSGSMQLVMLLGLALLALLLSPIAIVAALKLSAQQR